MAKTECKDPSFIPAMASSSYIPKTGFKYDVFLSFRGEDTRTSFVDHLYHALKQENIETYKDDENLERGKKMSKELIQAIEDSRFHVIVFSKNYASSSWCLDELVKIMECQEMTTEHIVYPIFYDVEPTHVRKQSGEFGKAFSKHENDEAAEKWRKALVEATSFSGKDLTVDRYEVKFIKTVVKEISLKLPSISAHENLVGMRTRINGVVSSLNAFPDEFCMIGITGMGGIGKTTLSRAVFDQISFQFEGKSFVANVREVSKPNFSGLNKLQQQVLRDVSNDHGITINNVFDGKSMMKLKMPGRKVLVVLDDVDHIEQLKALAGEPNWFMPGSKIIITARDKQVLLAHKVNSIHDVNLLTDEEAICLLSRCAFGTEIPSPRYKELSGKVVSYAAGLPLTITILGSTLYGETEHVWEDTLKELEKLPLDGTLQRLELSYKGLDTNCREIFLDVACILKGWMKDEAIRVLESCGFHAIRGLSVLEKKSLVTTRNGRLDMHDHIEEMGRYIVRRLHPDEPNKHSRLWIMEEIKDILVNNQGTEAIKCISMLKSEINLGATMRSLRQMEKLRLLINIFSARSDWKPDKVSKYLPNSLRYLKWFSYPFRCLPKTFQASDLVCLDMSYGKMEQLWEGGERKVLHKLRFLKLRCSKLRTFDLGLTPNLEILDLEDCCDLVELHMLVGCPKLKPLNLNDSKLSRLDRTLVPKIETLNLKGCIKLVELYMPCEYPRLKSINLSGSRVRSVNLGPTQNIEAFNFEYSDSLINLYMPYKCPQLKSLKLRCPNFTYFNLGPTQDIEALKLEERGYFVVVHMFLEFPQLESLDLCIPKLRILDLGLTPNLKTLKLQNCYNLVELRMPGEHCKLKDLCLQCPQLRTFDLGPTQNIEALTLEVNDDLVELSIPIGCLQLLKYLTLVKSKLKTLELTRNLNTLNLEHCDSVVELHIPDGDVKLKFLTIKRCSKLKTVELTHNLNTLNLEDCDSVVELHIPDGDVKLEFLTIKRCSKLKTLELTRNLNTLNLFYCDSVVELHIPDGDVKLEFLTIKRCSKLKILGRTPNLESLCHEECSSLVKLPIKLKGHLSTERVDICTLQMDNSLIKFQSECSYKEDVPSSVANIEKLVSEGFYCARTDLESFFGGIVGLQHLRKLKVVGNISELPEDLDRLQCLRWLTLKSAKIKHLPDSICMLKHLESLKLCNCELLEKLPEDLHLLEFLDTLKLELCVVLRDIPNNICGLKSLRYFSLWGCYMVEELPEELGRLECLRELDIELTRINNLPQSILLLEEKGLQIFRPQNKSPATASETTIIWADLVFRILGLSLKMDSQHLDWVDGFNVKVLLRVVVESEDTTAGRLPLLALELLPLIVHLKITTASMCVNTEGQLTTASKRVTTANTSYHCWNRITTAVEDYY
ncbi:hypothetical protein OSB04_015803 [Centaurea solstitialis]|uniref:TIR domain-containing protein n=1 Tax=Centaurea solstitialis TaxID=347529 RepID=A0AA38SZV5_9ASTR|nr:hypothetical protein OSB04_015803 [Centaurea solstitialis]